MSHTEGKLSHAHRERADGMYSTEIHDVNGETVAEAAWYVVKTETGYTTNREEDARRLVACWNAMNGIDDPELWVAQMKFIDSDHTISVGIIKELQQERDELLSWLSVCDDLLKEYAPKYDGCSTEKRIAEILARYQEGKS